MSASEATNRADAVVLGVDGSRKSWVAALQSPGDAPTLHWCAHIDDVMALARHHDASIVGIDMPIGLPESEPRASDAEARSILGPRYSCLFPTPVRAVLGATSHSDAVARSRASCGKGISVQTWHLLPSISVVRSAVATAPDLCVVEVHPETSFAVLAGAPLPPKRFAAGVAQRAALLEAAFAGLDVSVAMRSVAGAGDRRPFAADDLLDALAACWSARRFAQAEAQILGHGVDAEGFPMTLVV